MNLGEYADDLTTLTIAAGGVSALIGFGWRFLIVPSIRKELGGGDNAKMMAILEKVCEEVSNTHQTNLREDLDAIHADVRGARAEIGGLRSDFGAHLVDAAGDKQHMVDLDRRITKAGF